MGRGRAKGRSSVTYSHKLNRLKKWHQKRVEARKSWSEERLAKAKELKPLEWYVEQLRKPAEREKKSTPSFTRPTKPTGGWW